MVVIDVHLTFIQSPDNKRSNMIKMLGNWNDGQQVHETEANIPIFSTSPGLNLTGRNPFGMEPEADHSGRLFLQCITRNCDADLFGS